jgi:reductive dehalogenase
VKLDANGEPPDLANLPKPTNMADGPPDPANLPMPPEMEFLPQEIPEEYQYAIVTAYEMDYTLLNYYQTYINVGAIGMGYSRVAITNNFMAAFIRNLGYKAITSTINRVALHTPMAMLAGLGEVGRHGMLITPQFGPRVRLGVILTDLPLVPDAPIEFGVTEFCNVCMKCADMCPSKSISKGERIPSVGSRSQIANTIKWEMNPESCQLHWFRGGKDCATCLSVCPYNKVNTWPHRAVRWFSDNVRWLDSFYVKMDDVFGYGKLKNPSNFWKEWEPRPFGRSEK